MRRFSLPQRRVRRDRLLAWSLTAGVHLIVLTALFWPRARPPASPDDPPPPPIQISLGEQPKPQPPGPPAAAPEARQDIVAPPQPVVPPTIPVITTAAPDNSDLLSEAELAGATSAGEGTEGGGGGGGRCDTARAVQQALRRDPLVRAAVADANRQGKATMLWNGDWVQSGGQDGKGLSAVREAVMWKIAFIPEACRNERMHGLVLLSLADGGTRFGIGAGDWRWSDLLGLHSVTR